ncbi:transmembrane protein 181-like isoform X2 [Dendronephthya gigantea]|uniref:transmembrane protein 181-like isoform X2 n=1 Tax=Dendronephthya gigantea TaxID=151771 RepID=UPI001069A52F|nr:transmembrane protein 181-like isoform X2 [Dendronephthya gigantea]XP_028411112.1 transmembrane protein 181-like isoform X2 [Dendronephthya gigantea]
MESSIKMKLYSLTKRQFVLVFVVFFTCIAACAIIGLAGPSVITSNVQSMKSVLPLNQSLSSTVFKIDSGSLSTFSQQLWLTCLIKLNGVKEEVTFKYKFHINVKILYEASDNSHKPLSPHFFNHTRETVCSYLGCDEFVVFHLGYLDYHSYLAIVSLSNLDFLPKGVTLDDVVFTFSHYSVSFSEVEIWFRFVFVVLTFMVSCIYANSLRRFPFRDWSIEQRWMSVLLPMLLLFNDPIFPLHFLVKSWVPGMFESMFRALFLAAILLFWLCAFHGIRVSERHLFGFYMPKILLVGLVGISAFTLTTWQQYNELRDPAYQSKLDISNFTGFKIFFFIITSIYLVYLIYLVAKAYTEIKGLPYFDIRLKFLTALMVVVVVVSFIFVMLRYGRTVLQNNFIAELETTYKNTAEFLMFYGLLNFYLYTMSFVYSPARNALYDSFFKDNPSMSMINDSDEEIYRKKVNSRTSLTSDD